MGGRWVAGGWVEAAVWWGDFCRKFHTGAATSTKARFRLVWEVRRPSDRWLSSVPIYVTRCLRMCPGSGKWWRGSFGGVGSGLIGVFNAESLSLTRALANAMVMDTASASRRRLPDTAEWTQRALSRGTFGHALSARVVAFGSRGAHDDAIVSTPVSGRLTG